MLAVQSEFLSDNTITVATGENTAPLVSTKNKSVAQIGKVSYKVSSIFDPACSNEKASKGSLFTYTNTCKKISLRNVSCQCKSPSVRISYQNFSKELIGVVRSRKTHVWRFGATHELAVKRKKKHTKMFSSCLIIVLCMLHVKNELT